LPCEVLLIPVSRTSTCTNAAGRSSGATVLCNDGNGSVAYTQEIPFTDFLLDEVKLYFANNVIHLPSEYWLD
jgi:hypothetical protein